MDLSTTRPSDSKQHMNNFRKPRICILHLLDRCILKCKMCVFWKNTDYVPSVTLRSWEKFLVSLKEFSGEPMEIALVGGEPLMHNDIFRLINLIHDLGFNSNLTSNGFLINSSVAGKLVKSNLNRIALSLDSLNIQTHDYLRGRAGSYEKTINAIKYLRSFNSSLEIVIVAIIMDKNIDDIISLVRWAQENKDVNCITLQAVMQTLGEVPDRYWYKKDRYKELWPQDINKVCQTLDCLIKLKEEGYYKISNSISQLKAYKEYFNNPGSFIRRQKICNCLDYSLFVNYRGQIYLCTDKSPIGHIDQDINEVYSSVKAQEAREQIISCKKNCHFLVNCNYEN